jgi:hypothetical protein
MTQIGKREAPRMKAIARVSLAAAILGVAGLGSTGVAAAAPIDDDALIFFLDQNQMHPAYSDIQVSLRRNVIDNLLNPDI